MRFREFWVLCCALLVLALSLPSAEAVGRQSKGSAIRQLPLWKVLPTDNYVALKEEERVGSRWVAYAYRSPRAKRSDRLCLQIPTAWKLPFGFLGSSPGVRECGSVGQNVQEPVVADSAPIHGLDKRVVVIATAPEISVIDVKVRSLGVSLGVVQASTRTISGRGAAKARTSVFNYAVFILPGDGCLRQISGEGSDGTTVFETPESPCSAVGP